MSSRQDAALERIRRISLVGGRAAPRVSERLRVRASPRPYEDPVAETVRLDKVLALRQAIATGTYRVSAETVAECLLKKAFWQHEGPSEYPA